MAAPAPTVLVVEDHPHVAKSVQQGLRSEGLRVGVADTGRAGLVLASSGVYDLLILDLTLPGGDGLDVLRELRRQLIGTPVLVVTARDALSDRLLGFEAGADDYLVKPFALPELLARVRAILHRTRVGTGARLTVDDLDVDLLTRRCVRAGRSIDLAPKEFELLAYLMSHAGRIVTREMLGQNVWNALARGTPLDNVIDVHIGRLRRKIDADGDARLIRTVRGLGFMVQGIHTS